MPISFSESKLRKEFKTLQTALADDQVYQQPDYPEIAKRFKKLQEIINLLDRQEILKREHQEAQALTQNQNPELVDLAQAEIEMIDDELQQIKNKIQEALRDNKDQPKIRNECLMEIRAGVGGLEASLFAADLYRMYVRWAEKQKYKTTVISHNAADLGGFKEIIFELKGQNIYANLRYESGVHRVQRVPTTESQGRIHTSTASVAVLAKANPVELEIKNDELRIDTYRSSGHGGQSVNKTESAVRITHLPSGLVVICQDEKSQLKNKERALSILRARLLQQKEDAQAEATSEKRQKMIGKAERNEKIRTYNFPQNRLTDHRLKKSFRNLSQVIDGDALQDVINYLKEMTD